MSKKNTFIDFLKGIAILLVLIGHCIQYGNGAYYLNEGLYWDNWVMKIIYSFHMPLFTAISGYLFCYSVKKHGMISSIKSRVKRLVPVCFTWAFILSIVDFANGNFAGIKSGVYYFLTDFWFLWAIIFCVCCVAVIEWAEKFGGGGSLAIGIMVVGFIITPDILWTHAYKYVAPYFVAGYYYAKRKRNWLVSNKVGIAAAILWLVTIPWYTQKAYIYTTGITFFRKENVWIQLLIDGYRYWIGAAGVITVIWILKKLYAAILSYEKPWGLFGKKLIEYVGRNSITFYILSTYLFAWILPALTKNFTFSFVLTLIETVVVTFACDAVGRLIKCSKAISRWLIAS